MTTRTLGKARNGGHAFDLRDNYSKRSILEAPAPKKTPRETRRHVHFYLPILVHAADCGSMLNFQCPCNPEPLEYCPGCVEERTGSRIRVRREAMGLTLDEVAREAGVHRQTLYRIENGKYGSTADCINDVIWALLDLEEAHAKDPIAQRMASL